MSVAGERRARALASIVPIELAMVPDYSAFIWLAELIRPEAFRLRAELLIGRNPELSYLKFNLSETNAARPLPQCVQAALSGLRASARRCAVSRNVILQSHAM